jgi:hypothetical protein
MVFLSRIWRYISIRATVGYIFLTDWIQYGVMAEILAYAGHIGSEAVNCSAPDTGNMGEFHVTRGIFI